MDKQEIYQIKKAVFTMYSNVNTFVNTDTGVLIVGEGSFNAGSFYISGKRHNINDIAIVLKRLPDLTKNDLVVLSTVTNTQFKDLQELSTFLKSHIVLKDAVIFYTTFVQLGVALPYLNKTVKDLVEHKIIAIL